MYFRRFCNQSGDQVRGAAFEQPSLLSHLNVDACGLRVAVAEHILDRFDIHTVFHHQAAACMAQRVCCNVRTVDADLPKPSFDDGADGHLRQPLPGTAMCVADDQRLIPVEVAAGDVILEEFRDHLRHGNRIAFVHLPLTLDMDDGASIVGV